MPPFRNFFSPGQVREIESAIQLAERDTSGEIRVHIENYCKKDSVNRAVQVFRRLNMHKTDRRNGVLFYLAVKDKKFCVMGDEGIHRHVPEGFWNKVRDKLQRNFEQKKFTEGLCTAIEMTGAELKKYFPLLPPDKNELPDEITFQKQ